MLDAPDLETNSSVTLKHAARGDKSPVRESGTQEATSNPERHRKCICTSPFPILALRTFHRPLLEMDFRRQFLDHHYSPLQLALIPRSNDDVTKTNTGWHIFTPRDHDDRAVSEPICETAHERFSRHRHLERKRTGFVQASPGGEMPPHEP